MAGIDGVDLPLTGLAILLVAAIAVITDLRSRRIRNWLTLPAMAGGIAANGLLLGPAGVGLAFAGLLLGFALFLVPVAMGGMGAGDLKLLAALGALGGPGFVVWCAICGSLAGGVMALGALLYYRQLVPVVARTALALSTGQMPRATSNIRLPYAIPIACGAVAALALV